MQLLLGSPGEVGLQEKVQGGNSNQQAVHCGGLALRGGCKVPEVLRKL